MDQKKIGQLIRGIRMQLNLTQRALAQSIGVTEQAVSKWERGLGCPDVSLLPQLSQTLGVRVESLLSGTLEEPTSNSGSMRQLHFYVCPQCGNLMTALNSASLSCCGRTLAPLVPQKADEAHALHIEPVEDEWFLTSGHPMEKSHYLSFAALVKGDQLLLLQRWPEWDFQLRLPRHGHGMLFWYCTCHGLFRKAL